jgi:hypothetical protein
MRTALSLLLSLSLALLAAPAFAAAPAQPVLTIVRGDVSVMPSGGAWGKAANGMALSGGDSVKTGPSAKAEISFASGAMRLFENTLVVIPGLVDRAGGRDVRQVAMEDGSAVFRIDPAAGAGFSVKTRHVIAGVKGTTFAVIAGADKSRVITYFGLVAVTGPGGGAETGVGTDHAVDATPAGVGAPQGFPSGNGWSGWSVDPAPGDALPSAPPGSGSQDGGGDSGGSGGGQEVGGR